MANGPPPVVYVRTPRGDIACRVFGEGPVDMMFVNPMSRSIETLWDYPANAAMLDRLASGRRLIMFDRRGCGISDSLPSDTPPTWEDWLEDILAVLDHLGVADVVLLAERDAAAASMLFASSHPERSRALVLGNTSARFRVAPDYPCGESDERSDQLSAMWDSAWGTESMVSRTRSWLADDPEYVRWVMRMQRVSYSPRRAGAEFRYIINFDARSVLSSVQAPTLLLHRRDFAVIPDVHAHYLAGHIRGAHLQILPGSDMDVLLPGDTHVLEIVEKFLVDIGPVGTADRRLTTVLRTGILQARQLAANLGESQWQVLLDKHNAIVRSELARFQGREAGGDNEGFLVTFDGPSRAIRFVLTVRRILRDSLQLEITAGLHSGECERAGEQLVGPAVDIASAVLRSTQPGEVLATANVKALGAGSGIEFRGIGLQTLPDVQGRWELYALDD